MLIKYIMPLDRYAVNSPSSVADLCQRLRSAVQADLPPMSMPVDAAIWQGNITENGFRMRNAITSAARGRGYSAVVCTGRITARGSGSRIVVWQRFSILHMIMMLIAIGFPLAMTGLDFNRALAPAAALWLLFVVAFQISSRRQKAAFAALVAFED